MSANNYLLIKEVNPKRKESGYVGYDLDIEQSEPPEGKKHDIMSYSLEGVIRAANIYLSDHEVEYNYIIRIK